MPDPITLQELYSKRENLISAMETILLGGHQDYQIDGEKVTYSTKLNQMRQYLESLNEMIRIKEAADGITSGVVKSMAIN